jgi:DNA invertase Pin-like site-specific DNA recombinase
MKALPYLRVSTDDKGQEPLRQLDVVRPWAAREGVELLDPEIDEGTSASKTNPLDRARFVAACERAKAAGADAIVVEVGDRFGRRGSMESAWAEYEMGLRFGLKLWRADKPLAQHGTMVARVTDTIHDEGAREWVDKHKSKVRSGMARAKAEGKRMGRPPKPLTDEQIALVRRLRAEGLGWRRIARAVSEERGAFKVADPRKQRERAVTHAHVARVAGALGIP